MAEGQGHDLQNRDNHRREQREVRWEAKKRGKGLIGGLIHAAKKAAGLGGADNVHFDEQGNVWYEDEQIG